MLVNSVDAVSGRYPPPNGLLARNVCRCTRYKLRLLVEGPAGRPCCMRARSCTSTSDKLAGAGCRPGIFCSCCLGKPSARSCPRPPRATDAPAATELDAAATRAKWPRLRKRRAYSITSSAGTSRESGTARPSAFAVLRLPLAIDELQRTGARKDAAHEVAVLVVVHPFLLAVAEAAAGFVGMPIIAEFEGDHGVTHFYARRRFLFT
jgi:hypothetical protein